MIGRNVEFRHNNPRQKSYNPCPGVQNFFLGINPSNNNGTTIYGANDPFRHIANHERERQLCQMKIDIPIIKERSQNEIRRKTNRRKQKIEIISSKFVWLVEIIRIFLQGVSCPCLKDCIDYEFESNGIREVVKVDRVKEPSARNRKMVEKFLLMKLDRMFQSRSMHTNFQPTLNHVLSMAETKNTNVHEELKDYFADMDMLSSRGPKVLALKQLDNCKEHPGSQGYIADYIINV